MPTITDGTKTFDIEEGQSYNGWTLESVEVRSLDFAIGTHAFTFIRGDETCCVVNEQWPGERALCGNGKFGVSSCPPELALFSHRTTKVVAETKTAKRREQKG
jgi:hypothetical protein